MLQSGLGHAHRIILAHRSQADMNGLTPERVLGAATVLLHQALGHETGQIAMHLGGTFIDGSTDGRETGTPSQPGQCLEHGQTSLCGLHTLATLIRLLPGILRRHSCGWAGCLPLRHSQSLLLDFHSWLRLSRKPLKTFSRMSGADSRVIP
ncbi:hypothetical protein SDC9_140834 [bioreactor metagenome]|uniref:Uncharacterized protein n=1 Tax=bioreactor metagenome TaxID=1076179 RepID=A0A645DZE0_9ZZZZ